jgi:hypothetical protein
MYCKYRLLSDKHSDNGGMFIGKQEELQANSLVMNEKRVKHVDGGYYVKG